MTLCWSDEKHTNVYYLNDMDIRPEYKTRVVTINTLVRFPFSLWKSQQSAVDLGLFYMACRDLHGM